MCGLFAVIGEGCDDEELALLSNKISYRGPDESINVRVSDSLYMGFHRLSIMDESSLGSQPITSESVPGVTLICNGEIYNYKSLEDEFEINSSSNSDCEVILHLYKKMPFDELLSKLDGVFAFVLHDKNNNVTYAARDRFGVRPLFIGRGSNKIVAFASEAKAIIPICNNVKQLKPGTYWSSNSSGRGKSYYSYRYKIEASESKEDVCSNINMLLTNAVRKRLMSDREVGCLLSGGLDSSLVSALVQKNISEHLVRSDGTRASMIPKRVKTFSIGFDGSPDLKYAKRVAAWIGSDHYEVLVTPDDFLSAIDEVIYKIESYDTTTVRASVGNYLVSKYIKENTDCKVIFNGDGADEVCVGYVYNKDAPSLDELQKESVRLVKDIHLFDVLRSDRSISSNGLEPRTPFLDKDFVQYYMKIDPLFKSFNKNSVIEKFLLRKAFESDYLLPDDVLWRNKCAFSDGVSNIRNSWHSVLREFVDGKISDSEYMSAFSSIKHCRPLLKESYYYRKIFESHFGKNEKLIPYYWMPKWTDVIDPSARELSGYKE